MKQSLCRGAALFRRDDGVQCYFATGFSLYDDASVEDRVSLLFHKYERPVQNRVLETVGLFSSFFPIIINLPDLIHAKRYKRTLKEGTASNGKHSRLHQSHC